MKYQSVCIETPSGKTAFVSHCNDKDEVKHLNWINSLPNILGYVGCNTLGEAMKRASMMERDATNAWGPI